MGKLMNRISGLGLLISSLPGSALRTHVNFSASLAMSTSVLKALPGKLDIKRHSLSILYLSYDVASGSELTSCIKIDKPLVVYIFPGNLMTSITKLHTY